MEDTNFMEAVQREWGRFLMGKSVDCGVVQPYIFDSWLRCRSHGLDPKKLTRKYIPQPELQGRLENKHNILEATSQVLNLIFEANYIQGLSATLYDTDGVLLYSARAKPDQMPQNLQIGAIVKEEVSGTNAVSLCLQEKRIIEIRGAEHYYSTFHNFFCSSIPVWHEDNLQAVLNFTLPVGLFHDSFRNLIQLATSIITDKLATASILNNQDILLKSLEEGVIIFAMDGSIQNMNPKARQICGFRDKPLPDYLHDIFSSKEQLKEILIPENVFKEKHIEIRNFYRKNGCTATLEKTGNCGILILHNQPQCNPFSLHSAGSKPVFKFEDLKGSSQAHKQMLALAKIAAKNDITTLILGESGTGKELVAQAIHNDSDRAQAPFVAVNCGALPPDLVQSELFGYEDGAFTGANKCGKAGKFELANNGTIFLDEIGEMPLAAQVSLLRVIQSGEITRIGAKSAKRINERIIAATNKNLFEPIQKKEFREDLFYRLNIFSINMPPLRTKPEDIKLLAEYFLDRGSISSRGRKLEFAPEVLASFEKYAWPGNIRELQNTISRMVLLATGTVIGLELVPDYIAHVQNNEKLAPQIADTLLDSEKICILQAIRKNCGNLRAAAKSLGISRSGLYLKMQRMGISPAQSRSYGEDAIPEK